MPSDVPRCPRGHPLRGANLVEESAGNGVIRKRCRTCRNQQRRNQRARERRPTIRPGQLDLATLYAHTRPSAVDLENTAEAFANGTARASFEQAHLGATEAARLIGAHPRTVTSWLNGTPIQRRYQQPAARLLTALGTHLTPTDVATIRDHNGHPVTGDSILLVGGKPGLAGPWHHTTPTTEHARHQLETILADLEPDTNPVRWFGWWPCAGFVGHHEDRGLLESHGYLDDPRTLAEAGRCHGQPHRWVRNCPNGDGTASETGCRGVQPITAASIIHSRDLYAGHGCPPEAPCHTENPNPGPARNHTPRDPQVTTTTPP